MPYHYECLLKLAFHIFDTVDGYSCLQSVVGSEEQCSGEICKIQGERVKGCCFDENEVKNTYSIIVRFAVQYVPNRCCLIVIADLLNNCSEMDVGSSQGPGALPMKRDSGQFMD